MSLLVIEGLHQQFSELAELLIRIHRKGKLEKDFKAKKTRKQIDQLSSSIWVSVKELEKLYLQLRGSLPGM